MESSPLPLPNSPQATTSPCFTPADLLRTVLFAAEKHKNQRRKDAEALPYINHPLTVANILANEGGIADPVVLFAALLHDTLEDTATTYEELEAEFGAGIAEVVREVSDDKSLSPAERKRLQVEHAPAISPQAKLADKIANLRDLTYCPPAGWPLARKREYFDWAKAVVDGLRGISPPLEAAFDAEFAKRPE
jgi:guanosine-3',5'-bis(diphosphate) 3'-pyrophosphohydrolase